MRKKPAAGMRFQRDAPEYTLRAVEGDPRRFGVSFSSELPYTRWWGPEILDHGDSAVDMARLSNIGVALYNHDRDRVLGRLENVRIEGGRGLCDIVFDEDTETEVIYGKVASGTLKGISVGYRVDVWEEVMAGKKSTCGRFTGPCTIARKWTPMEISVVSVPADASVGVGRGEEENAYGGNQAMDEENRDSQEQTTQPALPPQEGQRQEQTPVDVPATVRAELEAYNVRQTEIRQLCQTYGLNETEYLGRLDVRVDQVRQAALQHLAQSRAPIGTNIRVSQDEGDKFRAAATDALVSRFYRPVGDEQAEGARELRGISLLRMAERCLRMSGIDTWNMSNDTIAETVLGRAYLAGDGVFGAIMDQTAGKIVKDAYAAAPTTYGAWVSVGSLGDFKAVPTYRLGEADELEELPPTGELKSATFLNQKPYTRQLKSYGKKVAISLQMLVNDDIGQFTKMIKQFSEQYARQLNRTAYQLLAKNPKIEIDGKELFHADHKNTGTPGAISIATLGEMRKLMLLQKGLDGKTTLNLLPRFLAVPAALEMEAMKILHSVSDASHANSGVMNVLRNSMEIIVDAELDALNDKEYYSLASANATDLIGVDFLNGHQGLNVRRSEPTGQLGMQWDLWNHHGFWVGDYRGVVKNKGQ